MAEIWLTSDTHFNHSNIIQYGNRPFRNVREMDEALIENWNAVVKPQDHVYHLGDVYMKASKGYAESILYRLQGHKRLVLGNHDNGRDQILWNHFKKIYMLRDFKEFGIVLTHIPMYYGSIKKGRVNVHGHVHQNDSPKGPYYNVCVERTEYSPVHIEDVAAAVAHLAKKEENFL